MAANGMDTDAITFVNVFEVESEKLASFLAVWRERARFLSQQPGFRCLRLLRALSEGARFQVVSVMEWDDVQALRTATSQDEFHLGAWLAVDQLGVVAYPGVYRTALTVSAP